ncbi:MAG TPA: DUF4185 domain-containing protein [Sedimentisphaerales bacterium]|nr:DUF4185 domain-containing protein [Sedimentisphaerales bacterium]
MRTQRIGFGLLAVFLMGCVPSLHRLYDDDTVTFDPRLIGRWAQGNDVWTNVLTFEQGEGRSYKLAVVDKDDKTGQFVAHLVRLEGMLFMDVFPGEITDPTMHDVCKRHLIPGHLFWKVDSIEPNLKLAVTNSDTISTMIKDDPACIRHEKMDEADQLVLTADTKDLQKFVVKLARMDKGFGTPEEFVRLGPLCPAQAVQFDNALVGDWSGPEGYLTSTASDKSYDLIWSDAYGPKSYRAVLVHLEQARFWAVFRGPVQPVDGKNVHMPDMLVWIEQTEPMLRLRIAMGDEMLEIAKLKGPALRQRLEQLPPIELKRQALAGGAGQIKHGALEAKYSVEPMPQYDALFTQEKGWTGADGAYSVALSDMVTLWLYGDTWIGNIVDGQHKDATMINYSIALQSGKDPSTASVKFIWQETKEGKPAAFIAPADGVGEFWMSHGIMADGKLYLFLRQVVEDGKYIGMWLGEVGNPQDEPLKWRIKQYKVPFGRYSENGNLYFGVAFMRDGDFVYIYGCDEDWKKGMGGRSMIAARVPPDKIADFEKWRFWNGADWGADVNKVSGLFDGAGAESSVSFQPAIKKYVAIYTEYGMSANIMMRVSDTPIGPWSKPYKVYKCPEYKWHKTYFCYAGKGHPELSGPDELIITYVCNSTDFWQMARDARIYRPRFFKIKFDVKERH